MAEQEQPYVGKYEGKKNIFSSNAGKHDDLETLIQRNESIAERLGLSSAIKGVSETLNNIFDHTDSNLAAEINERNKLMTDIANCTSIANKYSGISHESFYKAFDGELDASFLGKCSVKQLEAIYAVVKDLRAYGEKVSKLAVNIDDSEKAKYEKWLLEDDDTRENQLTDAEKKELQDYVYSVQTYEDALQEYTKTLEFAKESILKSKVVFETAAGMKKYDLETLDFVIKHLDAGDLHRHRISSQTAYGKGVTKDTIFQYPSESDLQIVSAMKTFGIDLTLTFDKDNGYKWAYKGENSLHILTDKNASFSAEEINAFLDKTLNLPVEARAKNYSARSMLATFASRAGVANPKGISPDQLEVQVAQLLDDNIMMVRAQKQAVMEVYKDGFIDVRQYVESTDGPMGIYENFEEQAKEALSIEEKPTPSNLKEMIAGTFSKLRSSPEAESDSESLLKSLTDLNNAVSAARHDIDGKYNQVKGFTTYAYDAAYNASIALMEKQNRPEIVQVLKVKRDQYIANVIYQKQQINTMINTGLNLDDIFAEMSTKMLVEGGMKLEMADDGTVKLGGKAVEPNLADIIKSRINFKANAQSKGDDGKGQDEEVMMSSATAPTSGAPASPNGASAQQPIILPYDGIIRPGIVGYYAAWMGEFANQDVDPDKKKLGEEFCQVLSEKTTFDLAVRLFQKGNYLDKRIHELTDGPNGISLDEAFKKIQDEITLSSDGSDFMFHRDLLKQAYVQANPNSDYAKNNPDAATEIRNRDLFFQKQLLLVDLASDPSNWSEEDYNKYYDPSTPEKVKSKMVLDRINVARKQYEQLSPAEINKRMIEAEKRHKGIAQKLALKNGEYEQDLTTYEAQNKLAGQPLTSLVQQFMAEANANIAQNSSQIGPQQIPQETQEQVNENDNEEIVTFGDLYPSGPNLAKFQKKMKPFCGKELMKNFFDPLLESIAKIRINMNAAKQNSNENASTTPPPQRPATPPTTQNQQQQTNASTTPPANQQQQQQNAATTPTAQNQQQQANQAPTQQPAVKIGQREFEASVFMPASIMMKKLCEGKDENDPMYETLRAVSSIFDLLSTVDENPNNPLCVKNSDGKDLRDDLRWIMFDVSEGRKVNDPNWVKQELVKTLNEYHVDTKTSEAQTLMTAFEKINPIAMKIMLHPTSESLTKDNKPVIRVGSKLPVEELSRCQNDKDRMLVMQAFTAQHVSNRQSNPIALIDNLMRDGFVFTSDQKDELESTTFEIQDVNDIKMEQGETKRVDYVGVATHMLGNVSEQEKSALIDLAGSQYAKLFEDAVKTGNVEQLRHMLNSIMPAEVVSEEEYDDENLPI